MCCAVVNSLVLKEEKRGVWREAQPLSGNTQVHASKTHLDQGRTPNHADASPAYEPLADMCDAFRGATWASQIGSESDG